MSSKQPRCCCIFPSSISVQSFLTAPGTLWQVSFVPVGTCLSLLSISKACMHVVRVVCSASANYALDAEIRTASVYNSAEVREVN